MVCGGAALLARQWTQRTTRDVDILAFLGPGGLMAAKPLPPVLIEVAKTAGGTLGLAPNWLNASVGEMVHMGLPEGLESRLLCQDFGPALSIYFIGREDQIAFKLLAAVESEAPKHVEDLISLNPTEKEMAAALKWCILQDESSVTKEKWKTLLYGLGHAGIAEKL